MIAIDVVNKCFFLFLLPSMTMNLVYCVSNAETVPLMTIIRLVLLESSSKDELGVAII